MTYKRFEDLPFWLYERTDDFLAKPLTRLRSFFRNRLKRAVLSISNNIAEGFERGTTKELLQFIYISRGSSGEVRSMLALLNRRPWAKDLNTEISGLKASAEGCSRQLRVGRFVAKLGNHGPAPSQREDQARVRTEEARRGHARLLNNLPPNHPLRRAQSES